MLASVTILSPDYFESLAKEPVHQWKTQDFRESLPHIKCLMVNAQNKQGNQCCYPEVHIDREVKEQLEQHHSCGA